MTNPFKDIPPPPLTPIEPERVAGAQERWEDCPLRDCKNNADLLYSDFYLRDMRTNRLMCNACTVKTDAGYIAREVVRSHDSRFYTGDLLTDGIMFSVMFAGSFGAHLVAVYVGYYIAFAIGGAVGASLAIVARKLAGKRVTRLSHYIGTAGIVFGALLAPAVYYLTNVYALRPESLIDIAACTIGMVMASWGVFLRRI